MVMSLIDLGILDKKVLLELEYGDDKYGVKQNIQWWFFEYIKRNGK